MADSSKNGALKTIHRDLSAIGLSVDEAIGRNVTNQHTRTSLRDIRDAIDSLQAKIADLGSTSSALTKREEEILLALATGKTALAIAQNLSISEPTVKTHVTAIYRKLNVKNKTSALAEAMRRGLLSK